MSRFASIPIEFEATTAEKGIIEGYAYTWAFDGGDVGIKITPGAFSKTIKERVAARKVPVQLKHASIATVLDTVGELDHAEEDDTGLFVRIQTYDTPKGKETYELAKNNGIKGMSVGIRAINTKDDEVELWTEVALREITLTNFPVDENTHITATYSEDTLESDESVETVQEDQDHTAESTQVTGSAKDKLLTEIDVELKLLEVEYARRQHYDPFA